MRLKEFQEDPKFTLPLLDILKDDPELYVRRSVANHLADIPKDHADVAYEVCERWLKEVGQKNVPADVVKARKCIVRHAERLPAKNGDPGRLTFVSGQINRLFQNGMVEF
jgi:3-methyladenine DNA glycosylase AlkC